MRSLFLISLIASFTQTYASSTLTAPSAAQPLVYAYEDWVSNAAVGDFIVRRHASGTLERREVTHCGSAVVDVKVTYTVDGKKLKSYLEQYRRKPSKADEKKSKRPELTQVDGSETVETENAKLSAAIFTGIEPFGNSSRGENWRKIKRLISAGVPLGGVVKEWHAPFDPASLRHDAIPDDRGRFVNNGEPTDLAFEVVEFGRGKKKVVAGHGRAVKDIPSEGE
jgi:hypothetical protein